MIERMLDGLLSQGRARATKTPLPQKANKMPLTIEEIRRLRAQQTGTLPRLGPGSPSVETPLADTGIWDDTFSGDAFLASERSRQAQEHELNSLHDLTDVLSGHRPRATPVPERTPWG